ncbi:pyridoxal phosphate-dependent transferase [Xylaria arbuscula]|nr:pyridoxal phosphate-dependent transferase [Xylaria arbuscula]
MSISSRAAEVLEGSQRFVIWDVVKDLWDPNDNPSGYINLGLAKNSLVRNTLSDHIHQNLALPDRAFTYGDGTQRLKRAVAQFINRRFQPYVPIESAHITICNGCNAALEHIAWGLANSGDTFLLGQPYYGSFIAGLSLRFSAKVLPVAFQGLDPMGINAVQKYEDQIVRARQDGQPVTGIVLCNPHNALGRCYGRDVLIGYMRLCQKYQIHLIVDEIYALSVFENTVDEEHSATPFISCLAVDPTGIINPSLLHVLWGFSKTLEPMASGLDR